MKKSLRLALYAETWGKCGYCWNDVPFEKMQVDHVVPQSYNKTYSHLLQSRKNLLCTCRKCNHYKRAYDLPYFRGMISTLTDRLDKVYIYEVWKNFWIIQQKEWDLLFYFENIWLEKYTDFTELVKEHHNLPLTNPLWTKKF